MDVPPVRASHPLNHERAFSAAFGRVEGNQLHVVVERRAPGSIAVVRYAYLWPRRPHAFIDLP